MLVAPDEARNVSTPTSAQAIARPIARTLGSVLTRVLASVLVTVVSIACADRVDDGGGESSQASARAVRPAAAPAAAPADTDDFGAAFPVDASVSARIVSLNPTATELLYTLGVSDRVVGRSVWDEYPAEVKGVPSVGNGIGINVEAVLGVRPTLVVLYATPENRSAAEALQRAGVHTIALRVDHIADFMALTTRLGRVVGEEARARIVRDTVMATLDSVRAVLRGVTPTPVVWPVWLAPTMVIGGGSFLDELITIAGGRNVFHDNTAPSPAVSIEEIARRDPDFVVASDSTMARLRSDAPWKAVRAVRDSKWLRSDPALTGRPSVVLGMAAVSLARAMHPDRAAALPE